MNRGNGRRRRKKKVTGRFFSFVAVIVVIGILIGVFIATRNRPAPTIANSPEETLAPGENQAGDDAQAGGSGEWAEADPGLFDQETLEALTEENKITISESDLSVNTELPSQWLNVLLLGSDTRNMSKNSRTDTIMIASINLDNGQIKLTSLLRDMWIEVPERGKSEKINNLAYYGGPQLAMKRINELFALNIEKYVMVNFLGMQEAIDALGGVLMDITEDEMKEINKTMISQLRATTKMTPEDWARDRDLYALKEFGKDTKLTGLQAVAFARIRSIGNGDFDRTNRQQRVMDALLKTVKDSVSIGNVMSLSKTLLDHVSTNYTLAEIVQLGTVLIRNGLNTDIDTFRVPESGTYTSDTRGGTSALYETDFEKNKQLLYNFIYNP